MAQQMCHLTYFTYLRFHLFKSLCDLENEIKVTKIIPALKIVQMIYLTSLAKIHPLVQRHRIYKDYGIGKRSASPKT